MRRSASWYPLFIVLHYAKFLNNIPPFPVLEFRIGWCLEWLPWPCTHIKVNHDRLEFLKQFNCSITKLVFFIHHGTPYNCSHAVTVSTPDAAVVLTTSNARVKPTHVHPCQRFLSRHLRTAVFLENKRAT